MNFRAFQAMSHSLLTHKQRGQGVVEYAGALIICAVMVATALMTLPPNLYMFIQTIQNTAFNFLLAQIQTIGG